MSGAGPDSRGRISSRLQTPWQAVFARVRSIRGRLLVVLVALAIPASALLFGLAWRAYSLSRGIELDGLVQDSELVAARLDAVPVGAGRIASTLAEFGPWEPGCEARLRRLLSTYVGYAALGAFRDGRLVCEVQAEGRRFDLAAAPLAGLGTGRAQAFVARGEGSSLGVVARGGAPRDDTAVVAVIDPDFLRQLVGLYRAAPSSVSMLSGADGSVLVAGPGWPLDAPLRHVRAEAIYSAVGVPDATATGEVFVSRRRLAALDVYLVTAQTAEDVRSLSRRQFFVASTAPLLILAAVALALWLGLSSVVLRWMKAVGDFTQRYAGDPTLRLGPLPGAPTEFAELAESFDVLADRVAERNAALEHEVEQKRAFIREIHHRVKNNLQVVGSLLALKKRAVPERDQPNLQFLEDRINAMSAAYRASYAHSEEGRVQIGALAREVVSGFRHASARGIPVAFVPPKEDREIDLDTAISLAMLLAELLPDAIAASVAVDRTLEVWMATTPQGATFTIRGEPTAGRAGDALSRRFVAAYLRQLKATLAGDGSAEMTLYLPTAQGASSSPLERRPAVAG